MESGRLGPSGPVPHIFGLSAQRSTTNSVLVKKRPQIMIVLKGIDEYYFEVLFGRQYHAVILPFLCRMNLKCWSKQLSPRRLL